MFSQTSFQAPLINVLNPRAVYFGDTVAVGWVRGGRILEVAAQDPAQGVIFYELAQTGIVVAALRAQQRLSRLPSVVGNAWRAGPDGSERVSAAR